MGSQIIAIGGGGFLVGSELGLDTYVLQQTDRPCPRIGFIATASGDAQSALVKFYTRFASLDCQPSHLGLFDRTPDIAKWINAQDIIYVGGGNTRSMLAVWRDWGLPQLLADAMRKDTVLAGISAGAICWFDAGVTDSMADHLMPIFCLGFLAGSCCPHYSGEPERRSAYEVMISAATITAGIAIDDGAAVHFLDGQPHRVISGRNGANAYFVNRVSGGAEQMPMAGVGVIKVY